MNVKKAYTAVNSFAPRDGEVTVFFKAVGENKSDGFAVIDNGKVFVIDVGRHDRVINFLASLRESWLGDRRPKDGSPAKLEITLIVSHAHGDHMGALSLLLNDERFCVTEIYAPCRSCLGDDVPGALPPLLREEKYLASLSVGVSTKSFFKADTQRKNASAVSFVHESVKASISR